MSDQSKFVKQKFAEYYQENVENIQPPTCLKQREFGFVLFKEKMMVRHRNFLSEEAFKKYLVSLAPLDVYYSSAYYEKPEASMEKKGWLGADLIFDIDSDHIETSCKRKHKFWICRSCDNAISGIRPKLCPQCGSSSIKEEPWLCETCLEAAKAETLKLIDFLIDDFGVSSETIEICFSGQRGYHARVQELEIRQLDQAARKEITDYISGTGLIIELHVSAKVSGGKAREIIGGPDLNDPGWDGRIARGVYGLLSSSTPRSIGQFPRIKGKLMTLFDSKDIILENWNRRIPWTIKGIGMKTWKEIIQSIIKNQAVAIDTVVTTDTHRLIRLPLTLHGKTGLMAVNIPINSLERFDPLKDAIAFKTGTMKVVVNEAHQFQLGDEEFGPYERQTIELPMAVAIYLLCKKVAVPVNSQS